MGSQNATEVSIPLRKFRKTRVSNTLLHDPPVSIPLRKFRKRDANLILLVAVDGFHPSKEV